MYSPGPCGFSARFIGKYGRKRNSDSHRIAGAQRAQGVYVALGCDFFDHGNRLSHHRVLMVEQ